MYGSICWYNVPCVMKTADQQIPAVPADHTIQIPQYSGIMDIFSLTNMAPSHHNPMHFSLGINQRTVQRFGLHDILEREHLRVVPFNSIANVPFMGSLANATKSFLGSCC